MKIRQWIGCVLALAGLAGCAAHTDDYAGSSTTAAGTVAHAPVTAVGEGIEATAEEHLARLDGLALFDVGELLVGMPEMATNCYGPCPEWTAMDEEEQAAEIEAIRDTQEARLAALVAIAEDVRAEDGRHRYQTAEELEAATSIAQTQLDAIAALRIIEVGELVVTAAENNPYCYNLPCAEDEERAAEQNWERMAELAEIATRAEDL